MKKKTFVCVLLISYIVFIALIMSVSIYIDPLFQYHQRLEDYDYPITNEGYQNPGIVKTFSYNALVTGSSMMQNNRMEWYRTYISPDTEAVKVTYAGATAVNIGMILETALKSNAELKDVYIGCDVYLWGRQGATYQLPAYLYDQDRFNDVNYVLNKKLIFEYTMPVLFHTNGLSESTDISDAYWWAQDDSVCAEDVIEEYRNAMSDIEDVRVNYSEYVQQLKYNMENYLFPLIESYPHTTFHFIFPPYHMMYWETMELRNIKDIILESEEYLLTSLMEYENVKIHYFSTDEDIIYDFGNYLDSAHYKSAINEYMVMCIGKEDHLLKKEDVGKTVEKLKQITDEYDYQAIFAIAGNMW